MPIKFACDQCGRTITVRDELAGKKGRCPGCQSVVTVPADGGGGALAEDPRAAAARAARQRAAAAAPEPTISAELDRDPFGGGDAEWPEPVEDEEVPTVPDDDLPEPGSPAAVAEDAAARRAARRAEREGAGGGAATSASRFRGRQEAAKSKKKGGFLWVLFGLLLAVVHTAAGVLAGFIVTIMYLEERDLPESQQQVTPILKPVVDALGFETRIKKVTKSQGSAGAQNNGGDANESEAINANTPQE